MAEDIPYFVQIFFVFSKQNCRLCLTWVVFVCACALSPCIASGGNAAFIRFVSYEQNTASFSFGESVKTGFPDASSAKISSALKGGADESGDDLMVVWGHFASDSKEGEAQGIMREISHDCEENSNDKTEFADLPKDWVGIIHLGRCYSGTSGESLEKSVIERMKTALMFGASAIIILSMNPKLIKEVAQFDLKMLAVPVLLIDSPENITTILSFLSRKVAVKVKIALNSTLTDLQKQTTFTWWTSCGWSIGTVHGRQWAGVVCLDKQDNTRSKADPSSFWNFFYTALLLMMLMFMVKTKRRDGEWGPAEQDIELSLRRLAHQALCMMTIKRFRGGDSIGKTRDMCAICLEYFVPKQKIRVLPCRHEFHTRCVDTWLVKNRTCPLCKLNILGHQDGC